MSAMDSLGIEIHNEASPGSAKWGEGEEEIQRIATAFDAHFAIFDISGKCVCGRSLGGLFGTFTYGIQHGEGWCSRCDWPARANHYVEDTEGEVATLSMVFAYAPLYVQSAAGIGGTP